GIYYRQVPFEERMPLFYRAADVVVCRAGANTVAELAAVGAVGIMVPLPSAPGDHQAANAAVLADAGGALVLSDDDCTGSRLATELESLLLSPGRLDVMRKAAAALGHPDAVAAVVAVVVAHARGHRQAGGDAVVGGQARS
ncbi:MAG: glycosyltransferase, partial [Acidimicrobiales bacterium]